MVTLENLMFTRNHFPIVLREATGDKVRKFWDFSRIEVPPYHPSMTANGINFALVPELLADVVQATAEDLEAISDKRADVQALLRGIVKNSRTGRVTFESQVVEQNNSGVTIDSVPIVGRFYVGKTGINPYGYSGDQGISINPESASPTFRVPEKVTFSQELIKEYQMTDAGVFLGSRTISCPNGWYRHNLGTINAIFYKNLVIALDNAIVRENYQKTNTLEDDLELVNFPTEESSSQAYGAFKVIQLYVGERPVMIFGSVYTPHFEILKSFLVERGIRFETLTRPSGGIPTMGGEGQPYKVVGAGDTSIYTQSKQFTLPEGCSTFHGDANQEHSAIFERRMLKDGWTLRNSLLLK